MSFLMIVNTFITRIIFCNVSVHYQPHLSTLIADHLMNDLETLVTKCLLFSQLPVVKKTVFELTL